MKLWEYIVVNGQPFRIVDQHVDTDRGVIVADIQVEELTSQEQAAFFRARRHADHLAILTRESRASAQRKTYPPRRHVDICAYCRDLEADAAIAKMTARLS